MTSNVILWTYTGLLVLGGLIGFLKAGSRVSLVMSLLFAVPLALCAAGILRPLVIADVVLAVLAVFFGMRFQKTKKIMPAGMMAVLSLAALIARLVTP